jgi:hypothetical protein
MLYREVSNTLSLFDSCLKTLQSPWCQGHKQTLSPKVFLVLAANTVKALFITKSIVKRDPKRTRQKPQIVAAGSIHKNKNKGSAMMNKGRFLIVCLGTAGLFSCTGFEENYYARYPTSRPYAYENAPYYPLYHRSTPYYGGFLEGVGRHDRHKAHEQ